MLKEINKAVESITVGNIKVLGEGYNKNDVIQSKVLIQALKLSKNSYSEIVDMSSDGKITPVEKQNLLLISNDTNNEYAILLKQYTDYSLTGNAAWTAHVATYTALAALLSDILADMTTTYTITGDSLETLFAAYYATRKTAEDTMSTYLQLVLAKVSQFGVKLNVSTFAGAVANGSVYPHGFDGSGDAADVDGNIYYLGARITITAAVHATGFTDKKGYLYVPVAGGSIGSCYYHAGDNEFKTSAEATVNETTNILIGEFNIASSVIGVCIVYNSAKPFDDMRSNRFLELLQYASSSGDFANMLVNMGIQYFNYLAVNKVWANQIETVNLLVGLGTGAAASGFRFRANYDNQDLSETAVFDVYMHDKVIFKIYPATGNIDFGDFTQGGLRWENSTNTIRSKDDKLIIGTDGKLAATDGIFSGSITAGTGGFLGSFSSALLDLTYPITLNSGDSGEDSRDILYAAGITTIDTGESIPTFFTCDGVDYIALRYQEPFTPLFNGILYGKEADGTSTLLADDSTALSEDINLTHIFDVNTFYSDVVPTASLMVDLGSATKYFYHAYIRNIYSSFIDVAQLRVGSGTYIYGMKSGIESSVSANTKANIFVVTTSETWVVTANITDEDNTTDRYSPKTGYDDAGSVRTYWVINTASSTLNIAWTAMSV